MSDVSEWMARQPNATPVPAISELQPRQKAERYVKHTDGSMVTHAAYADELRHGVLAVLKRHGGLYISEIRQLMSHGFFVGEKPTRQAAEISGALKHLLKNGQVRHLGNMPYIWEAK